MDQNVEELYSDIKNRQIYSRPTLTEVVETLVSVLVETLISV